MVCKQRTYLYEIKTIDKEIYEKIHASIDRYGVIQNLKTMNI